MRDHSERDISWDQQEWTADVEPSSALMSVTVTFSPGGAAVVVVTGEVDLGTAPQISEHVDPLWGTTDVVVVDLTGVTFLGSAGIAQLLRANAAAAENGSTLVLVAQQRPVLRTLEIAGLLSTFTVQDTLAAALGEPDV